MDTPSATDPPHRIGMLGAVSLAAEHADELLLGTVRDVHSAVAQRAWGLVSRVTRGTSVVPQRVHDGISRAVYGGLGAGLRAASSSLRAADRRGKGARMEDTSRGRYVVSLVNGLIGDRLVGDNPAVAIRMAVRLRGEDVPTRPAYLAAAFPEATSDLVVFVHGLFENESFWNRDASESGGSYGDRLSADGDWTTMSLRINTGLSVQENGVALAGLLDDVVAGWPVPVQRIALVGHSMGGLILRAACEASGHGDSHGHHGDIDWHGLVTDVVTLGTPHLGTPIVRGLHYGTRVLGRWPESAPFGRILGYRSVGINGLRSGLARDVLNLPHARYRLVAATVGASPRHPVSGSLGDLLVRFGSATGRPRSGREMFPGADVLHVPNAGHLGLLNHPEVYAALRGWLCEELPPPSDGGTRSTSEHEP